MLREDRDHFSRAQIHALLMEDTTTDDEHDLIDLRRLRLSKLRRYAQKPMNWAWQLAIFIMIHCMSLLTAGIAIYVKYEQNQNRAIYVASGIMTGWIVNMNVFGLLMPMIDLMQRSINSTPISPCVIHFQMMAGGVFGCWIGMLLFCYRPSHQPNLFICVSLVCTLCGLFLDMLIALIVGELTGYVDLPQLNNFTLFKYP